MGPLTAQALRRITGVGASPPDSASGSPTSFFTNKPFDHQPTIPADPQHSFRGPNATFPTFDNPSDGISASIDWGSKQPIVDVGSSNTASEIARPNLTLLTDVGRRYPGFPTPLSPTMSAKDAFPTPTSNSGSRAATPHLQSPMRPLASPMSLDGSSSCAPSAHRAYHGYEHFAEQMGNIDSVLDRSNIRCLSRMASRSSSVRSLSPRNHTTGQQALSPRVGMLRHMAMQQAFYSSSGSEEMLSPWPEYSNARKARRDSVLSLTSTPHSQSVRSASPLSDRQQLAFPRRPSIQIANGTEFETESPISPTGTMLAYTSNRAVGSGLLATPALSEPQVAEYRFWVPCGRRLCGFGCGGVHEGENAAAKRLFREAESITEQQVVSEGYGHHEEGEELDQMSPVVSQEEVRRDFPSVSFTRPVNEWKRFLMNKERDVSVAKV